MLVSKFGSLGEVSLGLRKQFLSYKKKLSGEWSERRIHQTKLYRVKEINFYQCIDYFFQKNLCKEKVSFVLQMYFLLDQYCI